MLLSTAILILFTILGAGAWGAHDSVYGMLAALTAYRFFIGIGIGGEYPAGSVAASEATAVLSKGHRNRWFVLFTNFMIDFGFVVSAFVPLVCLWIFGMDHLTAVWRLTLGLGAIPPISLFFLRLKFKEPEQFTKNNFKRTKVPYLLVIKYYGPRLIVVSLIWFIYDFSVYSFGIYSSTILNIIIPDGNLYKTFGWNTVINLFYMPGAFLGAFASDYLGPRLTLVVGVSLQAIVGYIMASQYENLSHHVASFVVVYGIFLSLGEFGPGDQIGTICSKTSASSIRGQYYGTAAAVGKIGAFIGTKTFPYIIKHFGGPDSVKGNQAPFWISSSLCLFSACLALFCLPSLGQDQIMVEDEKFRDYLTSNGFDTSLMGDLSSIDAVDSNKSYDEADVTREEDVYIEKS